MQMSSSSVNENSPCESNFFYHSAIVQTAQVIKLKQLRQLRRSNTPVCIERRTPCSTISTTGIGGNSTARACATSRCRLAPSSGAAGNCSSRLEVGLGTPAAPAVSAHSLWVRCSAGRKEAAPISGRWASVEKWTFEATENEQTEQAEEERQRARQRPGRENGRGGSMLSAGAQRCPSLHVFTSPEAPRALSHSLQIARCKNLCMPEEKKEVGNAGVSI